MGAIFGGDTFGNSSDFSSNCFAVLCHKLRCQGSAVRHCWTAWGETLLSGDMDKRKNPGAWTNTSPAWEKPSWTWGSPAKVSMSSCQNPVCQRFETPNFDLQLEAKAITVSNCRFHYFVSVYFLVALKWNGDLLCCPLCWFRGGVLAASLRFQEFEYVKSQWFHSRGNRVLISADPNDSSRVWIVQKKSVRPAFIWRSRRRRATCPIVWKCEYGKGFSAKSENLKVTSTETCQHTLIQSGILGVSEMLKVVPGRVRSV